MSLLIFLPLAGVPFLFLLPAHPWAKGWALAVTTVNAALSLELLSGFDRGSFLFQFAEHRPWIPLLNIHYTLGIDGISLLLILLTTLLMPLCVLCSWRYIQDRVREFLACMLIMETAMLGVFAALDFVLFYVLWELMLIPMFLLIGIWGGPRKIYASVKFFLYTLTGSVMLPVAMIALYFHQDPHTFFIPALMEKGYPFSFQILIFLAFFTAFAVKVPMFPFHTWLPAAHVEAPTAGSVLLASVLLKMGGYGFLRFCLPITPQAVQWFMPAASGAIHRRHPLRGTDGALPGRHEETGGLLQRRPHGLCHPGDLRPQHPGGGRGDDPDDQPRHLDGRPVCLRGDAL